MQNSTASARRAARAGLALGLMVSALLVGGFALVSRAQSPAGVPPVAPPLPVPPGALPPVAPARPPETVRITFTVVPAKKAMVFWGKKRLGIIAPRQPLVIQRPRDSGPLDVIVQSEGYLPVQTRAMSFADNKVTVKLTAVDQKNTLLGYRQEVPPDVLAPDGGTSPGVPPGVAPAAAAPPLGAAPPPGVAAPPASPDANVR